MTRQECEEKILEKLEEIKEIYKEYNPDGKLLSMFYSYLDISERDFINVNNAYWDGGDDEKRPINASRGLKEVI